MSTQNNQAQRRSWAGAAALALSLAAAALLLRNVSPAELFNTWRLTRAAGLVAFALLYLSVAVGLLQSLGVLRGITAPAATVDVHEHLSLWALYATAFHALILLWDPYVPFRPAALLLPFASDYEPAAVALGVIATYTMLAATVSSYVRPRLRPAHWRAVHLLSLAGFLFALIHGVAIGTDTGRPAVGHLYRFTGLSAGLLAAWRLFRGVWTLYAHSPGRR